MKKGQIILSIAIAIAVFILLDKCSDDRRDNEYNKEKAVLIKEADSLKSKAAKDSLKIIEIDGKLAESKVKINNLQREKDSIKKERKKIPATVKNLSISKVDSIINSLTKTEEDKRELIVKVYEHPKLIEENELLQEENSSLEQAIALFEEKDSVANSIIENKNSQIKNLESQVKLCENQLDKKNSSLFVYGQVSLNGWTQYGAGVDYVFKDKVIVGTSATYDSFYKSQNVNVKLGFKLR